MSTNTSPRSPRAPLYQHASDDDETAPLLSHFPPLSPLLNKKRPLAKDLYFRVILIIIALVTTVDIAYLLRIAPSTRLFEVIYCREYYQLHNPGLIDGNGMIEEELCKVDAIQNKLASLKGWLSFFQFMPGMSINAGVNWVENDQESSIC